MRHLSFILAISATLLTGAAAYQRAHADVRLPPPGYHFTPAPGCDRARRLPSQIYDDCADQMALFQRARAEAYGARKQLLVVFGANWCSKCRTLKPLLHAEDFRERHFGGLPLGERLHLVEIAISRLHDGRVTAVPSGEAVLRGVLEARPDVTQRAIPFVAAIDPVSGRTSARNLDDLDGPQGWNPGAVATILAAADAEIRGGPRAAPEPGWFKRKWQRWFGR